MQAWHRRRRLGTVALLTAASLMMADVASAGEPGDAGLLWLRLGIGARSGGMGETGVAAATDANAVYWNPANLAVAPGTQVGLQHTEYFGSLFRQEALTLSHRTPYGTVGLLFSGFYSEDIERTELDQTGVTLGTFRPYDVVGGIAYAFDFRNVSLGVTTKFLYERIDAYAGSTFALDLGIAADAPLEGLRMGAVVQNLGPPLTLDQEEIELPRTVRFGAAYRPMLERVRALENTLWVAEIVTPNDGNGRLHAGVELRVHELFVLRGGHRFAYDTWGTTFGAGFSRGPLFVDYAFMANDNDFDTTHRISLRLAYLP